MNKLRRLWPHLWRDIVLNTVFASPIIPRPLRWRLLKAYGMDISQSVISPRIWFGSSRISIGRNTFVNYGCMFNTSAPIVIGSNCDIAMQVTFVTSSHEIGGHERRAGLPKSASITVGNGVWIGARALILPGVTIGDGAVIAAGSVVAEDCKPNTIYAGVPAREIRPL